MKWSFFKDFSKQQSPSWAQLWHLLPRSSKVCLTNFIWCSGLEIPFSTSQLANPFTIQKTPYLNYSKDPLPSKVWGFYTTSLRTSGLSGEDCEFTFIWFLSVGKHWLTKWADNVKFKLELSASRGPRALGIKRRFMKLGMCTLCNTSPRPHAILATLFEKQDLCKNCSYQIFHFAVIFSVSWKMTPLISDFYCSILTSLSSDCLITFNILSCHQHQHQHHCISIVTITITIR